MARDASPNPIAESAKEEQKRAIKKIRGLGDSQRLRD
jgi:hypothetical protein